MVIFHSFLYVYQRVWFIEEITVVNRVKLNQQTWQGGALEALPCRSTGPVRHQIAK